MPAVSQAQQKYMAIAAHHSGKLHGHKPHMSLAQLHDFAATPSAGLPQRVGLAALEPNAPDTSGPDHPEFKGDQKDTKVPVGLARLAKR